MRVLGIILLLWSLAYAIEPPMLRPSGAFDNPDEPHSSDIYARTLEQAFLEGYINGHGGVFAQQSSKKDPSFVDLNMSLAYETLRWKGYKIGLEAWLNGKVFEVNPDDFAHNKDIFIISNAYLDFYNQYEKFGIRLGRYKINEEWITHNTEGLSIDYDGLKYISLDFTWAFQNAYVENYYACGFTGCDYFGDRMRRIYNVVGALFLRGTFTLPMFPLKITPYFYTAPGYFFTSALKLDMDLPVHKEINFKANTQFISYVQSKDFYGRDAGSGFLFLLDTSVFWQGLEGGLGLSATNSFGANMIDAFGQQSRFERAVGMFWGGATTIYGFVKYSMPYLDLSGAIRNTFINKKNVFNWEIKASGTPYYKLKGLQLGMALIGMDNTSEALDYFGGKQYLLVRGFVQYKF